MLLTWLRTCFPGTDVYYQEATFLDGYCFSIARIHPLYERVNLAAQELKFVGERGK